MPSKDKSYKFGVNVLFTENEGSELQNDLQSGNPRCLVLGKVSDAINLQVEIPAAVGKINRKSEGKNANQGSEGQRNGKPRGKRKAWELLFTRTYLEVSNSLRLLL